MIAESANYLDRIEDLRTQVSGLIADLPTDALNWRPLDGNGDDATNSLAVLAAHIAGAEHFWIGEVIGYHSKTRDRDSELNGTRRARDRVVPVRWCVLHVMIILHSTWATCRLPTSCGRAAGSSHRRHGLNACAQTRIFSVRYD
jgi:hypothetical protein